MADEIRRAAAALKRVLPRSDPTKWRRGRVVNVNDDGTVDILIPDIYGEDTGETYPRVHRLSSYLTPAIDDAVTFCDHGHGRYLCLGTGLGAAGSGSGGGGAQQQADTTKLAQLSPYQIQLDIIAPVNGSKSPPWYPRQGSSVKATAVRISVDEPVNDFYTCWLDVSLNGEVIQTWVMPPLRTTWAFPVDFTVGDGQALVVTTTLVIPGVGLVSVLFDVQ